MSPEDQKYYETYFDLFSSKGWKQFVTDLKLLGDNARNTMADLSTSDDMFIRKGNIQVYTYIEHLPTLVEQNYEAQQEDTDADV